MTTPRALRQFAESLRARAVGDFLGEREIRVVLALAEIGRAKQLLRGDDLRALVGRGVGELERALQVGNRIGIGPGLQEARV